MFSDSINLSIIIWEGIFQSFSSDVATHQNSGEYYLFLDTDTYTIHFRSGKHTILSIDRGKL